MILIDPLANTLFGSWLLLWQQYAGGKHSKNLAVGLVLMLCSFIVLSLGLFFSSDKISFLYPLITLSLFACAEFLLQTTLNAKIRDLMANQRKGEFLATGIMRSSRAFATVVGYYLMTIDFHANFTLYLIMACICLLSFLSYTYFYRVNLRRV